jgi:hypothetical protein
VQDGLVKVVVAEAAVGDVAAVEERADGGGDDKEEALQAEDEREGVEGGGEVGVDAEAEQDGVGHRRRDGDGGVGEGCEVALLSERRRELSCQQLLVHGAPNRLES